MCSCTPDEKIDFSRTRWRESVVDTVLKGRLKRNYEGHDGGLVEEVSGSVERRASIWDWIVPRVPTRGDEWSGQGREWTDPIIPLPYNGISPCPDDLRVLDSNLNNAKKKREGEKREEEENKGGGKIGTRVSKQLEGEILITLSRPLRRWSPIKPLDDRSREKQISFSIPWAGVSSPFFFCLPPNWFPSLPTN